jgi:hypothetical protein
MLERTEKFLAFKNTVAKANQMADLRKFKMAEHYWWEAANIAPTSESRQSCIENAERYQKKAENSESIGRWWECERKFVKTN